MKPRLVDCAIRCNVPHCAGIGNESKPPEFMDPIVGSVSLNALLTSAQKKVPDGAVIVLLDACRTEAGLSVTSVEGREDSRCLRPHDVPMLPLVVS
jgi:hypothetical protein